MDNYWVNALWSMTPTVLVGLIFWLVLRAILRADQKERDAYARAEREERARRAQQLAVPDESRSEE
ncbi:hypothetical protein ACF1AJ_19815 [Leifsonia sp. NPDC014704]|uniref:hypothetical protein n=1 Tax=Leifsonia sp. NPDC014704 TaxID=3364123 RepID=UPI000EAC55CA